MTIYYLNRHLSRLHLKTVLSLTVEKPIEDLQKFTESIGARSIHFPISRTIAFNDPTLLASLIPCLNVSYSHYVVDCLIFNLCLFFCLVLFLQTKVCIDPTNHPIYIHCLDGRKITGLLVLLIRRLQGWTPYSALLEFWRY